MIRVLIIDDDDAIRRTLELHLSELQYDVHAADSVARGRAQWQSIDPDLVLLDLKLPDGLGTDLLEAQMRSGSQAIVIMITGHHDMEYVVRAMKSGAFNYIHKPLDIDELDAAVKAAAEQVQGRRGSLALADSPDWKPGRIAGRSRAVLEIHKQIGQASKSRVNVLITGESGTGKELIARAIHENSSPAEPFVAVNCSALVPTLMESEMFGHEKGAFTGAHQRTTGKLEAAGGGTLFLDEIGDLPPELQSTLLRALQERTFERVGGTQSLRFEARVVAATNQPLNDLVLSGRFREDLYFRLNVVSIPVPPLRERREDIPELVRYLVTKINRELQRSVTRIPESVMVQFISASWPGNVRQLENVLTQAVLRSGGDTLHVDFDIAAPATAPGEPLPSLQALERDHIRAVLASTGGHLGDACKILGISRPTLRKKLRDYGLEE